MDYHHHKTFCDVCHTASLLFSTPATSIRVQKKKRGIRQASRARPCATASRSAASFGKLSSKRAPCADRSRTRKRTASQRRPPAFLPFISWPPTSARSISSTALLLAGSLARPCPFSSISPAAGSGAAVWQTNNAAKGAQIALLFS